MSIYLLVFCIVLLMTYMSRELDPVRGNYVRFLALCIIGLFPAFRFNVGQDYDAYEIIFNDVRNGLTPSLYAEEGYLWLNRMVIALGGTYFHVIFIMAMASVLLAGRAIQYFCKPDYHYLAFATLLTSTFYLIYVFSGIRQGFCMAMFLYSLKWIAERKFFRFVIWIVLGSFFHTTILCMLPMYFLSYFRMPFWIILVGVLGGFILASTGLPAKLFLQLTSSMNNHYMGYANLQNTPGNSSVGIGVILRIIAFTFTCFLGHWVNRDRKYDTIYNAVGLGLIAYAGLLKLDIMIRISDYLTAGIICLLPLTVQQISNRWDKYVFTGLIMLVLFILMLANLQFSNTQLIPYKTIFDYLS